MSLSSSLPSGFFQRFRKDLIESFLEKTKPGILYRQKDTKRLFLIVKVQIEPRYESWDQWRVKKEILGSEHADVKWFRLLVETITEDGDLRYSITHFSNNKQIENWIRIFVPNREVLISP